MVRDTKWTGCQDNMSVTELEGDDHESMSTSSERKKILRMNIDSSTN